MKRLVIIIVWLFTGVVNAQWQQVTQGKFMALEDISFADANNGIAVSDFGLHYTTDGGKTWPDYADWNMIRKSYTYVNFLDNQVGWILGYDAGEQGYFFKSTDAGKTWQQVANPVNGLMHKMFWLNSTVGFAFGGTRDICFRGDTTGTNVGYVWKTVDAGTTWTAAAVGKPYGGFIGMWMQPSGQGMLIGPYVIYTTTDFGNSWQKKSFAFHPNEILRQVHFFSDSKGLLFSYKYEGGNSTWIYQTNDGGITWQVLSELSNFDIGFINPVCVVDSNNIVLNSSFVNNIEPSTIQVRRSLDGGKTWKTEFKFNYNGDYIQTIKKIGNTYWGVGAQVWRCDNVPPMFTANPGDSIAYVDSQYIQQLKAVDVDGDPLTFRLLSAPGFLSVADSNVKGIPRSTDTGKYVIKVEVSDGKGGKDTLSYNLKVDFATGIEDELSIPTKFSLSQNYPNPFNPSTTIRYSIPSVGTKHAVSVQLKVFDLLGREVATLVNAEKPAGFYEAEFNVETLHQPRQNRVLTGATSLPSGVYFYRLQTGSFSVTKKMVLLK